MTNPKLKTIGVIGPNADSRAALIGNYHGTSSRYITVLEGIQDEVGEDVRVLYSEGCHLYKDKVESLAWNQDRISEAVITAEHSDWYRGTADALYQNLGNFPLKKSHEPYVVIAGGDCIYKLDYHKVLEYHIEKKADITVVCKDMEPEADVTRFGLVKTNAEGRITDFEEKPMLATSNTISCGIYVIRRRQLIELLERCASEDRYDFVTDILVRYKNLKRIYAYKLDSYWSNIASVDSYYKTNMDIFKA